jgi:hypothetical protein
MQRFGGCLIAILVVAAIAIYFLFGLPTITRWTVMSKDQLLCGTLRVCSPTAALDHQRLIVEEQQAKLRIQTAALVATLAESEDFQKWLEQAAPKMTPAKDSPEQVTLQRGLQSLVRYRATLRQLDGLKHRIDMVKAELPPGEILDPSVLKSIEKDVNVLETLSTLQPADADLIGPEGDTPAETTPTPPARSTSTPTVTAAGSTVMPAARLAATADATTEATVTATATPSVTPGATQTGAWWNTPVFEFGTATDAANETGTMTPAPASTAMY